MPSELKAHPRVRAAFEGTLERVSVHGGSVIRSAQVSNLSVGGCFVRGVEPVPVGELLHLRLHLPATGWTVASGEVVHCQPHSGFGARFLNLTTTAEHALAQAVDHLRANN